MARIRGVDTAPEIILRSGLHRAGLRFGLHRRDLPGRPDIVMPRFSAVIFVHGCFWHRHEGCPYAYTPKTRSTFWCEKLDKNRERDGRQALALYEAGWRVLVIWECALRKQSIAEHATKQVIDWLHSHLRNGEIGSSGQSERTPCAADGQHKITKVSRIPVRASAT